MSKIEKLEILWTEARPMDLCPEVANAIPTLALQAKYLDHAWFRICEQNEPGYTKTKVRVTLDDGSTYENRWDISPREESFTEFFEAWTSTKL